MQWALLGSYSEIMLVCVCVCLSVMGLQLKYIYVMVYVPRCYVCVFVACCTKDNNKLGRPFTKTLNLLYDREYTQVNGRLMLAAQWYTSRNCHVYEQEAALALRGQTQPKVCPHDTKASQCCCRKTPKWRCTCSAWGTCACAYLGVTTTWIQTHCRV